MIRLAGATTALAFAVLVAVPSGAAARPLDLPPPPPVTDAAPDVAPRPAALREQLAALQRHPQTRPSGSVGLAVIDAAGRTLASRHPDAALLPASTIKVLTAAAALRILGPAHRFVTRVEATAPPDADGVVDGDLVLVGGGDPVLATPTYRNRVDRDRPSTSLGTLAGRIRRAGVRRVTGRVLGDPSVLADQPLAPGWSAGYLTSLDTTRSSGLTVDVGLRLFRRGGVLRGEPAGDPALRAARELDRLLRRRGVRTGRRPATTRDAPAGTEVARIAGPRLEALLTHALQHSDNHLADGVFRMLGAVTGDPTWSGGARAVRVALADTGARWDEVRLADGSGLSRRDRLTAQALVEVLRSMANGPLRARWLAMPAIAARSGTMVGRLRGTPAAGLLRAKTGTLRDVRALAGTVPGRGGSDLHLAVLVNELQTDDAVAAARRLADVLALSTAVAQTGCRGPLTATGRSERRPPEHRICGAPAAGREQKSRR